MNPFYTMPNILTETSEGATAHSLQDELFKEREIELVGEITQESAYSIILQLRYLQKSDSAAPITVYINSPGGEVASGLALYDVMRAVKCPVRTVCVGTAASMAAILFASGTERGILPHGKIMIHDPLTTGINGSALVGLFVCVRTVRAACDKSGGISNAPVVVEGPINGNRYVGAVKDNPRSVVTLNREIVVTAIFHDSFGKFGEVFRRKVRKLGF